MSPELNVAGLIKGGPGTARPVGDRAFHGEPLRAVTSRWTRMSSMPSAIRKASRSCHTGKRWKSMTGSKTTTGRPSTKDKDEITRYVAAQNDPKGYVIIAHKGSNNILPIQACLYLGRETIQHVHNIIIAEEGAELHIISGCTSGGHVGHACSHGILAMIQFRAAIVTQALVDGLDTA